MHPLPQVPHARLPVHRTLRGWRIRMTGRAFFIGRFQPFHRGHLAMVRRILESNEEIIVGMGSDHYSHTGEDPFTDAERYGMTKWALDAAAIQNYNIVPIRDTPRGRA